MFNNQLAEVKKIGVAGGDNLLFISLFCVFVEELPGASAVATKVLSCVTVYKNWEARLGTTSSTSYILVYISVRL